MLALDLFRQEPETVRQALRARGEDPALVDRILDLDARRRALVTERDRLRAQHNEASRHIGEVLARLRRGEADPQEAESARAQAQALSDRIRALEEDLTRTEEDLNALLLTVPNLPRPEVPLGTGAQDNRVVRQWGEPPTFPFTPRPHWELGERLGILDLERGARLAGSRFFVLRGQGARLERALINWLLDFHTRRGYLEVDPPALVRSLCLVGSGNLPKFGDQLYRDAEEDLWLIPTAEVPLTNLHRDEILPPGSLPLCYTAWTPCFRRERASAGRETRGIQRVHQFDKVELYKFTEPDRSDEELERMVADVEAVCQALGIPYRVVLLCTGDLGFPSAKTYDIEMWAPGLGEWLEVSSCSNCTDFQARRANIRYRPAPGARPQFVHTLNGSGLGIPRTLIALLETYQQEDGTVVVPEVLRPYTGFDRLVPGGA